MSEKLQDGIEVGALVDAEHIANLNGAVATLRGIVVSVAQPYSQYNASWLRTTSVRTPDGATGTSGSQMPVHLVALAGSPEARAAVRQLLATDRHFSDRVRAALEAVA